MTAHDLATVLQRERDALAAETRLAGAPPFVAANNLDDVARLPSSLRHSHPATVKPLPGARGGAWLVECASLSAVCLWVATANDSYRVDYLTYLNAVHGLALERIPDPFDVDHLYNRQRAANYGLLHLRVALVDHKVNRSHGASVEKDVTMNEARRERRGLKLMDEIASMKYFGFLPPTRSDPRDEEIERYCQFARVSLGLDSDEVRKSVRYLRQKASTPWAR